MIVYIRNSIFGFVMALIVATVAGVARGHHLPRLDPSSVIGVTAADEPIAGRR